MIEAAGLTANQEQFRILDLIIIFREYTEKGQIKTIASILTSQINNLEAASRKIDLKTRALPQAQV